MGDHSTTHDRQTNEINAIKSIYIDEFEEMPVAWQQVRKEPCFVVHLRAFPPASVAGPNADPFLLDVSFKLPAKYPETKTPSIDISKHRRITRQQAQTILSSLTSLANELVGNEMIYELVESAKAQLNKLAKSPSVHQQWTHRHEQQKAILSKASKQEKASALLTHQQEQAKWQKDLESEQMEIDKQFQEIQRRKNPANEDPGSLADFDGGGIKSIVFASPLTFHSFDGHPSLQVSSISNLAALSTTQSNRGQHQFKGRPKESQEYIHTTLIPFAPSAYHHRGLGRKHLEVLCKQTNDVLATALPPSSHHARTLAMAVHVTDRELEMVQLVICREYAPGSVTLTRLLECSGSLSLSKSVRLVEAVLVGLNELYCHGIAHEDVCTENILLSLQDDEGSGCICIINPMTSAALSRLHDIHPFSPDYHPPASAVKIPKINALRSTVRHAAAALANTANNDDLILEDIWGVGIVLLQCLFGFGFVRDCILGGEGEMDAVDGASEEFVDRLFESPQVSALPESLRDFLRLCLNGGDGLHLLLVSGDSNEDAGATGSGQRMEIRKLAFKLLDHPIFTTDYAPNSLLSLPQTHAGRSHSPSDARTKPPGSKSALSASSRFHNDFQTLEFLGSGAFGRVFKVRNCLDARLYAIKQILLDPMRPERNQKVLREVGSLSRLYHARIVRYYQAWIEDEQGEVNQFRSELADWSLQSTDDSLETDLLTIDRKSFTFNGEGEGDLDDFDDLNISPGFSSPSPRDGSRGDDSEEAADSGAHREAAKPAAIRQANGKQRQYLYIQMEYCPNQSLQGLLATSSTHHHLTHTQSWRYFRQLVEALEHIHALGIIHRDLKPANVFLDSEGDCKIGDFGLAVFGNDRGVLDDGGDGGDTLQHGADDVMTRGVGTPVYMAPELLASAHTQQPKKSNTKLDQMIDIYSLGIILLELFYPFPTRMERTIVLQNARLPSVILPAAAAPHAKSKEEHQTNALPAPQAAISLIRKLIDHNPANRPTCSQLMAMLPPESSKDKGVRECIDAASVPTSPHYRHLIHTLFNNPHRSLGEKNSNVEWEREMALKEATFDYRCGVIGDVDVMQSVDGIHGQLRAIFRLHAAIQFSPPLLSPCNSASSNFADDAQIVRLITEGGACVSLPCNLVEPFARWIAHNLPSDPHAHMDAATGADDGNAVGGAKNKRPPGAKTKRSKAAMEMKMSGEQFRRFNCDPCYAASVIGGHPLITPQCSFDIVYYPSPSSPSRGDGLTEDQIKDLTLFVECVIVAIQGCTQTTHKSPLTLRLHHSHLHTVLFNNLQIPPNKHHLLRAAFLEHYQPCCGGGSGSGWKHAFKKQLLNILHSPSILESLQKWAMMQGCGGECDDNEAFLCALEIALRRSSGGGSGGEVECIRLIRECIRILTNNNNRNIDNARIAVDVFGGLSAATSAYYSDDGGLGFTITTKTATGNNDPVSNTHNEDSNVLAAGGFYDGLVAKYAVRADGVDGGSACFRQETSRLLKKCKAVGVLFHPLALLKAKRLVPSQRSNVPSPSNTHPTILIYSTHAGMQSEKISIAAYLWSRGHACTPTTSETNAPNHLLTHCTNLNSNNSMTIAIILGHESGRVDMISGKLRVRWIDGSGVGGEKEAVGIASLLSCIHALIKSSSQRNHNLYSPSNLSTSSPTAAPIHALTPQTTTPLIPTPSLNITLLTDKTNNNLANKHQRSLVLTKTAKAMRPLLHLFSGNCAVVEVVAHDLTPAQILCLKQKGGSSEDHLAAVSRQETRILDSYRERIAEISCGHKLVFMYGWSDGSLDLFACL